MLLAALLSASSAIACPAPTIGFAPPLDRPLLLERRVERQLGTGIFRQQISYRLQFSPAGRGFGLKIRQIALTSDGPPDLLRLLALQEQSSEGETLDVTLDATGTILGISESPDAPDRLARALARLRDDPAIAARSAAQQAEIAAMLDRLATLTPDERAGMHRAKFGRLVMFAGHRCAQGFVGSSDGTPYRLVSGASDSWVIEATRESSGGNPGAARVTDRAVLSPITGLIAQFERQTVTKVAGTERKAVESLSLSVPSEAPES